MKKIEKDGEVTFEFEKSDDDLMVGFEKASHARDSLKEMVLFLTREMVPERIECQKQWAEVEKLAHALYPGYPKDASLVYNYKDKQFTLITKGGNP